MAKLTENETSRRRGNGVRIRDTQQIKMIFLHFVWSETTQNLHPSLAGSSLCVWDYVTIMPSGKAGKSRALLAITESLQKAVCFQLYPEPVIRDALNIICLSTLGNRAEIYSSQSTCPHLLDYRTDPVTTAVRFARDITGFRTSLAWLELTQANIFSSFRY